MLKDAKQQPEEFWRKKLEPMEYSVLREAGTEPAFSGDFLKKEEDGNFYCKACGNLLFTADAHYDSKTGWPSYNEVASNDSVDLKEDLSHGMHRTEVLCHNCGSHLGHLFEDASQPTGKYYCINAVALDHKEGDADTEDVEGTVTNT